MTDPLRDEVERRMRAISGCAPTHQHKPLMTLDMAVSVAVEMIEEERVRAVREYDFGSMDSLRERAEAAEKALAAHHDALMIEDGEPCGVCAPPKGEGR